MPRAPAFIGTRTAGGVVLTLASAICFSSLGVLMQLAYHAGADAGSMLAGRFIVAAALLWPLVALVRARRPGRRRALAGLALGLVYGLHGWLYAESLTRLHAGLADLLLFTYPALVMLGALALRRDRWSRRHALALATSIAGITLALAGSTAGVDPRGAAFALAASVAYSAYILCSGRELERTNPLVLAALVSTSTALSSTAASVARADLSLGLRPSAYALTGAVGLVTVTGMTTFVAGISRLGVSRASIVSAVQPGLTPLFAFAVFADRPSMLPVLAAALVVGAVVVLESGRRRVLALPSLAVAPPTKRRGQIPRQKGQTTMYPPVREPQTGRHGEPSRRVRSLLMRTISRPRLLETKQIATPDAYTPTVAADEPNTSAAIVASAQRRPDSRPPSSTRSSRPVPRSDSPSVDIVVAFDGSDNARRAIETAARELGGGRAAVLQVWEPLIDGAARVTPSAPAVARRRGRLKAERAMAMAEEGATLARHAGFDAEAHALTTDDSIGMAIVNYAEPRRTRLVVIGTRGLSAVRSALTGSVTQYVTQHARVPVFAVPPDARA